MRLSYQKGTGNNSLGFKYQFLHFVSLTKNTISRVPVLLLTMETATQQTRDLDTHTHAVGIVTIHFIIIAAYLRYNPAFLAILTPQLQTSTTSL